MNIINITNAHYALRTRGCGFEELSDRFVVTYDDGHETFYKFEDLELGTCIDLEGAVQS